MAKRLRLSPWVWLIGLILFGFALRMAPIEFQPLWRDEIDAAGLGDPQLRMSAALAGGDLGQLASKLTQGGFNGPLYFIALQQLEEVTGSTALALRLPSALFGILAIPLTYVLSRRLFGSAPRVAPLATWLVAISPYFVWYSQEAKMYSLVTTLALAAIYALRRAIEAEPRARSWPWWLLAIGATTLAVYSHILAALLIGVEVVLFALWWPQAKHHLTAGLLALGALTLPYIPLAAWQLPLVFQPAETGFSRYAFDQIVRVMLAAFTHGVLDAQWSLGLLGIRWDPQAFRAEFNPAQWGTWLMAALVLLGALMWTGKADRAQRIGLALWALLPAAALALVSVNRPVFTDRYLIWIGPAVLMLAALGIDQLWKWNRLLGGAALVAATLVMAAGAYAQAVTPYKADFRAAAAYIEARYRGEPIVFQIPHGLYTFDYYFGPSFLAIEGPYTRYAGADGGLLAPASYEDDIANRLDGHSHVWLVASEVEMWDDRHLLEDWLNRHGRLIDRQDFVRVTVARYDLNP